MGYSKDLILDQVNLNGYAFIPQMFGDSPTVSVIARIGSAISLSDGCPVHQLRPQSAEEAPLNTYSGNYGLGEFPFHTDMSNWHVPPRYVLLRAIHGSKEVATRVIDTVSCFTAAEFIILRNALVKPRRPICGKLPLLKLNENRGGESLFRWDERYLVAASENGQEGIDLIINKLAVASPFQFYLANSGDTLILDNWRVLHSRDSVPESARDRVIDRVYLGGLH